MKHLCNPHPLKKYLHHSRKYAPVQSITTPILISVAVSVTFEHSFKLRVCISSLKCHFRTMFRKACGLAFHLGQF